MKSLQHVIDLPGCTLALWESLRNDLEWDRYCADVEGQTFDLVSLDEAKDGLVSREHTSTGKVNPLPKAVRKVVGDVNPVNVIKCKWWKHQHDREHPMTQEAETTKPKSLAGRVNVHVTQWAEELDGGAGLRVHTIVNVKVKVKVLGGTLASFGLKRMKASLNSLPNSIVDYIKSTGDAARIELTKELEAKSPARRAKPPIDEDDDVELAEGEEEEEEEAAPAAAAPAPAPPRSESFKLREKMKRVRDRRLAIMQGFAPATDVEAGAKAETADVRANLEESFTKAACSATETASMSASSPSESPTSTGGPSPAPAELAATLEEQPTEEEKEEGTEGGAAGAVEEALAAAEDAGGGEPSVEVDYDAFTREPARALLNAPAPPRSETLQLLMRLQALSTPTELREWAKRASDEELRTFHKGLREVNQSWLYADAALINMDIELSMLRQAGMALSAGAKTEYKSLSTQLEEMAGRCARSEVHRAARPRTPGPFTLPSPSLAFPRRASSDSDHAFASFVRRRRRGCTRRRSSRRSSKRSRV